MPSDSIAGFLDRARSHRLLFPEQIEQLIREPDLPQEGLERLCQYLLERGVLTPYQAEALQEGRGEELNIGGYPVMDRLGPCPGGTAYRVLHPALRLPLILRRIRWDEALLRGPAETFFERARRWGMWRHPLVISAMEVGRSDDDIFIILDPMADHADVETLSAELGGPMPGPLALETLRGLASVLCEVHGQGGVHGGICPAFLLLGPLKDKELPDGTRRRRPARDATVKLAELGLLPQLPPARQQPPELRRLAYLPPEMLDEPTPTPAADLYALGASLYFLLTARPPFKGQTPDELMQAITTAPLKPLARLRPDLPTEFVVLIERLLSRDPAARPSAAETEQMAMQIARDWGQTAAEPPMAEEVPEAVPAAEPASNRRLPVAVPVSAAAAEAPADWSETWSAHLTASAAQPVPQRRVRPITDEERLRSRRLLLLGGLLHLTAITLLLLWLFGAFSGTREPEPSPPPPEKKSNPIKPRPRPQNA